MYRNFVTLFAVGALALTGCTRADARSESALETAENQESYALGTAVGAELAQGMGDVESESFLAGISDGFAGNSRLSPEAVAAILEDRHLRELQRAQAEAGEIAKRNETVGTAFRESFAQEDGVVTLESGLQYKVLAEGEGVVPGPDATVTVHYRGALVDGTEFDSSYADQQPVTFPVGRVIPGWSEALQHMSAGSRWQVVVPPDLAYGDQGAGGVIEPGSTLVFEIELVEVS